MVGVVPTLNLVMICFIFFPFYWVITVLVSCWWSCSCLTCSCLWFSCIVDVCLKFTYYRYTLTAFAWEKPRLVVTSETVANLQCSFCSWAALDLAQVQWLQQLHYFTYYIIYRSIDMSISTSGKASSVLQIFWHFSL